MSYNPYQWNPYNLPFVLGQGYYYPSYSQQQQQYIPLAWGPTGFYPVAPPPIPANWAPAPTGQPIRFQQPSTRDQSPAYVPPRRQQQYQRPTPDPSPRPLSPVPASELGSHLHQLNMAEDLQVRPSLPRLENPY
jgi:hypothetical protein